MNRDRTDGQRGRSGIGEERRGRNTGVVRNLPPGYFEVMRTLVALLSRLEPIVVVVRQIHHVGSYTPGEIGDDGIASRFVPNQEITARGIVDRDGYSLCGGRQCEGKPSHQGREDESIPTISAGCIGVHALSPNSGATIVRRPFSFNS